MLEEDNMAFVNTGNWDWESGLEAFLNLPCHNKVNSIFY